MELQNIPLKNLKPSPLNVRKHGQRTGEDLIPSIKAVGLIQPLLVRKNCKGYEVVAGQRRLDALNQIQADTPVEPVPCLVMQADDDAKAIEASLIENIARLPMDAIDQFEAFQALIAKERSVDEIAQHFGVTERLVNQRLAIANLYAPIRNAFRREEITAATLQALTMATKRQQKEWFKLFNSEDGYAPEGHRLKSWLFGGAQIPTDNALFDIESFEGNIISDLFGDTRYFADPDLFWTQQSIAIAAMIEEYREDGWQDVILMNVGEHFCSWDYVTTAKEEGGKVVIHVAADGEVKAHEGKLSQSEVKRRKSAGNGDTKAERPELTKAMQNYLGLHRHAAVRLELLNHQGAALRLCVAQIIAGSHLWDVRAEPQKTNTETIATSLQQSSAQAAFKAQQGHIMHMLELGDAAAERPLVDHCPYEGRKLDVADIFEKLTALDDPSVMDILTFVVAETLPSSSAMVDGMGEAFKVDMATHWQPDQTFFDLMRDKPAINAMLSEIGGEEIANGNLTATAKTQKQIIMDFLNGNGRDHKPDWQPRYMSFPMRFYTERKAA